MTVCLAGRVASLAVALSLLSVCGLRADEPNQKVANPPGQVEVDPEVTEARVRLAEQIDKTVELHSFLDVTSKLVANSGLGIDVAAPDGPLKAQLNLGERQGLVVTAVPDESLGAKAGLKVHDVIVQLDEHTIGDVADLQKLLDAANGKEITLKVHRGGKTVELKASPKKPQFAVLQLSEALNTELAELTLVHAEHYRIGVTLSEADDTLRSQLGLAAGEGLVVTEVFDGTAAADASIRVHDVFTMLDGKRLATVEAINTQIQEIKDESVELKLLRGGKEMTIRITPRKTQEAAFSNQPVRMWETESCKRCHQNPHQLADPHNLMGWKLGVDKSAWTDGHHSKLFLYEKAFRAQAQAGQNVAERPAAQQQVEALKSQLAEMQKTLSTLESAIQQSPAKEEEKR